MNSETEDERWQIKKDSVELLKFAAMGLENEVIPLLEAALDKITTLVDTREYDAALWMWYIIELRDQAQRLSLKLSDVLAPELPNDNDDIPF